jgi:hypothetical protein
MSVFLQYARSTELYRQLCAVPATDDGNLLERTSLEVGEAQIEFMRWALHLARPRSIWETGTNKGMFAYLVSLLLQDVVVHTCDTHPGSAQAIDLLNASQRRIRCVFYPGDSLQTLRRLDVRPDFAWLDGGMATDVVLGDLLQCYRLGVPYLAVDDTTFPSVRTAVDYFVEQLPYAVVHNPFAAADQRKAVLLQRTVAC